MTQRGAISLRADIPSSPTRHLRRLRPALLGLLGLLHAAVAAGRVVTVPLHLDHEFVHRILLESVYTGEGNTTDAFRDGHDCNWMRLAEPAVDSRDGRLVVRTAARVRVGAWMGRCVQLHAWDGTIEVLEEPRVEAGAAAIRFRVVDSNIAGATGGAGLTGNLWNLIKSRVHPRLEELTVDLGAPLKELAEVLPLFLPQADVSRVRLLLNSVALADPRVVEDGLAVNLSLDISELGESAVTPSGPVPALSSEEIAAWEAAWQSWDAFLTYSVLRLARDQHSEEQLQRLREVFVEARYELSAALTEASGAGGDRVRRLFLRTWTRLRPIVRELSLGLPGEASLRYLSLIAAADALEAIDEVGSGVGVEISAEGLRRMARLLDPLDSGDPLRYDTEVDPELRRLLGLGTPIPLPTEPPSSSLLDWLVPRALASDDEVAELSVKLRGWAPTAEDAGRYLPLALRLLEVTRAKTQAAASLAEEFRPIYRSLFLTTAWQESCWRQFVRVGGGVKTLTSSAGALGMLQINPHVWRGIYDVPALRDDIGYNALAGGEIMLHYMVDYAIKKGEHTKTGKAENVARAAYAAYNGGPGHLQRYRKPTKNELLRRIDQEFWRKYRVLDAGNDLAVRECFG